MVVFKGLDRDRPNHRKQAIVAFTRSWGLDAHRAAHLSDHRCFAPAVRELMRSLITPLRQVAVHTHA